MCLHGGQDISKASLIKVRSSKYSTGSTKKKAGLEWQHVDDHPLTSKLAVDFDDLARHGRVNVRSSLDRLDRSHGLAGADLVADLGQLLEQNKL